MKPITLVIAVLVTLSLVSLAASFISGSNKEVNLRTRFEQKMDERKAFFDKMYKIINQKAQVTVQNDSSFRKNVEIIMTGRKDAEGTFMKWIQESNPNANYAEVSALYKDLSRAIEGEREGFFNQEKVIQDIVREHKNLLRTFPSNIIMSILGRQEFVYAPISSDITEAVFQSGKENNLQLF